MMRPSASSISRSSRSVAAMSGWRRKCSSMIAARRWAEMGWCASMPAGRRTSGGMNVTRWGHGVGIERLRLGPGCGLRQRRRGWYPSGMGIDAVIRGRRVVLTDGVRPASLQVAGGVIRYVGDIDDTAAGPVIDAGELLLMPGLFDSHVHVNEPGRTEWEGFATATRAAAAGGITAVADMPLNSLPVTTTRAALEVKAAAAAGTAWVDYALWGGVVPGNEGELEGML